MEAVLDGIGAPVSAGADLDELVAARGQALLRLARLGPHLTFPS
jgi:hypothetical protein